MALVKFIKERDREEGRKEGIEQGCETTALRMLREGIEADLVVKCTGLSHERLEELQKKAS